MTRRTLALGTAGVGVFLLLGVAVVRLVGSARPPEAQPAAAVSQPAAGNATAGERGAVETTDPVEPVEDVEHPPAPPPRPAIPPELAGLFDESTDTISRMKTVDALGRSLSPEALSALRWLLRKPDEDEALRNNVANRLRECGEEHLVGDLTGMAWDERETPKWRNYCVQHLYTCYEEGGKASILDTLFRSADPAETNEKLVRICAVWSLTRAATPRDESKALDEATLGRIRSVALDALREKDAHFLITTAGVQSCAHLGLKESLPDIRELAADDATKPVHLRVVSVAALGDLGDDSDLPLLECLASTASGQLQSAAALAHSKLAARAGGAP